MISYHETPVDYSLPKRVQSARFTRGFKTVDTNDIGRIAQGCLKYTWSPCVFKDGYRRQANFVLADWVALDIDGEMTLEQAKRTFCDSIHIIGTTMSHQKAKNGGHPCDRFRVVLKLARRATDYREYRGTMAALLERYQAADDRAKDAARFFYPCQEIISIQSDGYTEDVVMEKARAKPPGHYVQKFEFRGVLPTSMRAKLMNVLPVGTINTAWYGFAKDAAFIGLPYDQALAMVLKARTYQNTVMTPDLLREIEQCLSSGYRSATEEEEGFYGRNGQRDTDQQGQAPAAKGQAGGKQPEDIQRGSL